VEKMKTMESGNFASGASKAPRICVGITQEPTHMCGILDATGGWGMGRVMPRRPAQSVRTQPPTPRRGGLGPEQMHLDAKAKTPHA
ncbi:hypothetical protein PIB30_111469, partial [Stylosanthes scabra]|nr:hypothetical protein [Stylosanthes scabra]